MGWRDINMNRRRPPLRLAVVPVEPGADRRASVLRKAAGQAVAAMAEQAGEAPPALHPFLAGYLAGYARLAAMKHDVDCEEAGERSMDALLTAIGGQLPSVPKVDVNGLRFVSRNGPLARPRAALAATMAGADALADAGYLVGHLEAMCGTRKLVRKAIERSRESILDAGADYLTDCDVAADPMQTRNPMTSIRFTLAERAVIREAFASLDVLHSHG
jgi:hypothetical protein